MVLKIVTENSTITAILISLRPFKKKEKNQLKKKEKKQSWDDARTIAANREKWKHSVEALCSRTMSR